MGSEMCIRDRHPALEVGLKWLEDHRPENTRRTLVHGDFRNGNLIIGPEGIRAVLDWECCHIGNPLEDLGWLCTRSWRFGQFDKPVGGFGKREDLFAGYLSKNQLPDPDEVRYWDGGKWSLRADGRGASLELIDPAQDNDFASAWDASDETHKSQRHSYTFSQVASSDTTTPKWNEFLVGFLNNGEVLIDDVSVISNPG